MIGKRRLPGRPVIAAGVAATALLTGAGVAMAATSGSGTPSPRASTLAPSGLAAATPTPVPPKPGPLRLHGRFPFGPGFGPEFGPGFGPVFGPGPFGAVHGQFVVPKPGGGYQTVDTQRGAVTAVSTTSITVKSGDGFTKTYRVTASTIVDARRDGIGSIKTGQQVTVIATVSGSTATATSIVDISALPTIRIPAHLKDPASASGFWN